MGTEYTCICLKNPCHSRNQTEFVLDSASGTINNTNNSNNEVIVDRHFGNFQKNNNNITIDNSNTKSNSGRFKKISPFKKYSSKIAVQPPDNGGSSQCLQCKKSTICFECLEYNEKVIILCQKSIRRFLYRKNFKNLINQLKENLDNIILQKGSYNKEENITSYITTFSSANNIDEQTLQKYLKKSSYKYVVSKPIFVYKDNSVYQGEWNLKGEKCGNGIYIFKNGIVFIGSFYNDKINGYGKYIVSDKNYYEGFWVNNRQNGIGNEHMNGSSYTGNYTKGKKNGKGLFIWEDGSTYEGGFVNNTLSGEGRMTYRDGRTYNGNWSNNKKEGKGEMVYPNGNKYVGMFKGNKKEGEGTYFYNTDCTIYYKGCWVNGLQHGFGVFVNCGKIVKGIFRFGKLMKKTNEEMKSDIDTDDHKGESESVNSFRIED